MKELSNKIILSTHTNYAARNSKHKTAMMKYFVSVLLKWSEWSGNLMLYMNWDPTVEDCLLSFWCFCRKEKYRQIRRREFDTWCIGDVPYSILCADLLICISVCDLVWKICRSLFYILFYRYRKEPADCQNPVIIRWTHKWMHLNICLMT